MATSHSVAWPKKASAPCLRNSRGNSLSLRASRDPVTRSRRHPWRWGRARPGRNRSGVGPGTHAPNCHGWAGRAGTLEKHCAITVTSSPQLETRRFPTRPLQETLPALRKTTIETITTFSAARHSSSLSGLPGRLQVPQTHFAHHELLAAPAPAATAELNPVRRPQDERKDSFRTPRTAAATAVFTAPCR